MERKGYLTDSNGKTVVHKSIAAGSFSGVVGAFLGSPLFLIKTQLQSESAVNIQVGTQHHHRGALAAIRTIYRREGVSTQRIL